MGSERCFFRGYRRYKFRDGMKLFFARVWFEGRERECRKFFGRAQDAADYGRRVVARLNAAGPAEGVDVDG